MAQPRRLLVDEILEELPLTTFDQPPQQSESREDLQDDSLQPTIKWKRTVAVAKFTFWLYVRILRIVTVLCLAQAFVFPALSIYSIVFWPSGPLWKDVFHHTETYANTPVGLAIFAAFCFSTSATVAFRRFTLKTMKTTFSLVLLADVIWICYDLLYSNQFSIIIHLVFLTPLVTPFLPALQPRLLAISEILRVATVCLEDHKFSYLTPFLALMVKGAISCVFVVSTSAIYYHWRHLEAACNDASTCTSPIPLVLLVSQLHGFLLICRLVNLSTYSVLSGGVFGKWYFTPPGTPVASQIKALFYSIHSARRGAFVSSNSAPTFKTMVVTILLLVIPNLREAKPVSLFLQGFALLSVLITLTRTRGIAFKHMKYRIVGLALRPIHPHGQELGDLPPGHPLKDASCVVKATSGFAAIVGFLTATVFLLAVRIHHPEVDITEQTTLFAYILPSYLLGNEIAETLFLPLEVGVYTIFTSALAWPEYLIEKDPGLYSTLANVYPLPYEPEGQPATAMVTADAPIELDNKATATSEEIVPV